MKPTIFPQRDFRIVGRSPKRDLLDRWLSTPPEKRKRVFVCTTRAAKIAGNSRRTILDWIYSGKVLFIRIGNNYQILLKSLKTYICSKSEH